MPFNLCVRAPPARTRDPSEREQAPNATGQYPGRLLQKISWCGVQSPGHSSDQSRLETGCALQNLLCAGAQRLQACVPFPPRAQTGTTRSLPVPGCHYQT